MLKKKNVYFAFGVTGGRVVFLPSVYKPDMFASHSDGRSRMEHRRYREASGARMVVCDVVKDYRACALDLCDKNDVVLEIGCCNGHTIAALAPHVQKVCGVDLSNTELDLARETYPQWAECFHHGDALVSAHLKIIRFLYH